MKTRTQINLKPFLLLSLFSICFTFSTFAQKQKKNKKKPVIALANQESVIFSEILYDFGKIPQGKPAEHLFFIENFGLDTLKIENVQTSCGCTTPEYSKDPVLQGKKTQLKVGYNAATEGYFEKSITVTYNGGQMKQLIIKGTVWKTPEQSAPGNQSLKVFQ
jgi:hypothetical protein